tara:strand:+ start:2133 stop:2951 length:819 start_codon:yes stop_codon:yes gene_type:complete
MKEQKTLAIAMRVRDDLECLKENIEYHTLMGVEHFFIYDHKSVLPLKEELKEYKNVTVTRTVTWKNFHGSVDLKKCCTQNKNKFKWIAFLDVDEFLVMKDGNTDLKEFLKPYEEYGGLCVWWRNFGSSGHKKKQKSVIESYTRCSRSLGAAYKTILNTKFGNLSSNVHWCNYVEGKYGVDENYKEIKTPVHKWKSTYLPSDKKIVINHYIFRSDEEWNDKIEKWTEPESTSRRTKSKMIRWRSNRDESTNAIKDTSILELIKKVKEKNNKDD